jgi:hypothetical protein
MLDKLDGLPSDILALREQLKKFEIDQKYGIATTNIQSKYLNILS